MTVGELLMKRAAGAQYSAMDPVMKEWYETTPEGQAAWRAAQIRGKGREFVQPLVNVKDNIQRKRQEFTDTVGAGVDNARQAVTDASEAVKDKATEQAAKTRGFWSGLTGNTSGFEEFAAQKQREADALARHMQSVAQGMGIGPDGSVTRSNPVSGAKDMVENVAAKDLIDKVKGTPSATDVGGVLNPPSGPMSLLDSIKSGWGNLSTGQKWGIGGGVAGGTALAAMLAARNRRKREEEEERRRRR